MPTGGGAQGGGIHHVAAALNATGEDQVHQGIRNYDELAPRLRVDPHEMYDAIRAVGVEHCILSSDGGGFSDNVRWLWLAHVVFVAVLVKLEATRDAKTTKVFGWNVSAGAGATQVLRIWSSDRDEISRTAYA